jgi:hypothetical protein
MKKVLLTGVLVLMFSCGEKKDMTAELKAKANVNMDIYTSFKLTSDLSELSENQRKMIPILIEAANIMDGLFWQQSYGDKDELLSKNMDDKLREFIKINYGPWDRLDGNKSFVEGIDDKSPQANMYPADITKEEFEAANLANGKSLYTLIRRDEAGKLIAIPYHEVFKPELTKASALLLEAAALAEDAGFKNYLELRSKALLTSEYFESDMAWMNMTNNPIDFVVGPIENYEDQLFGYKAAFEAYVLIKDLSWSKRLAKYAAMLPALQKGLPVDAKYKTEVPGANSQLNAYDVVYYAGDCNAGSKTIAINLPNDEKVQLEKGTRRLQLKNAMQAKFDKILMPISSALIEEDQQKHITFDAFFANTMFHEVAHGLGIKETINGKGTVRTALKEQASSLEEGKADILGLYMITKMAEMGEFPKDQLMDNYVTFMTSIFRSIRFGAASAHGRANVLRFTFFKEKGAFTRDDATGRYKINFDKMTDAMNALSELILTLQGNGDYEGVTKLMAEKATVDAVLQGDLDRLEKANIPVDVVFDQGVHALGLAK